MLTWTQNYSPTGNLFLSALLASVPVIVLLGLLAFWHVRAHIAALIALIASLSIAIFIYGMPAKLAAMATVYGAAFGLFPIGWIVVCAIFIYDITVKTGKLDVCKQTIAGLAADRRIQALLIAFSFGAFIEGAAGFGTPVAISAAMLIGLGFKPLPAAGLALIGNTAPVAFGGLGTPVLTLQAQTGLDLHLLSAMVGRQLPLFSLIVPFWLVWAMAGFRGMWEVWPACLTCGLSFAVAQFYWSNYHGPELVDIIGALVSISSLIILLKVWQPKNIWRFEDEKKDAPVDAVKVPPRAALAAWMPWMLLSLFVFVWGLKPVKTFMEGGPDKPKNAPASYVSEKNFLDGISVVKVNVPLLHNAVIRDKPVVAEPEKEVAVFRFNWLSATGTSLLVSGFFSGLLLGLGPIELIKMFGLTLYRTRISLLTIVIMLALGYSTRFAGLDATMGLAFASTGPLFPFFSPLLGWLGVAVTGSDTASNVLFGNLQKLTAQQLGISPLLAAAANSSGGVMGKMIDAQSIVVASIATGQTGEEGKILRYVFWHSLVLAILVGVVVFAQAYWLTWMIPS
jgi:lactate permease